MTVANKTIGKCPCWGKTCEATADVRRQKNHARGALYLDCRVCNVTYKPGATLIAFIEKNAEWVEGYGPGIEPDMAPAPELVEDPAPEDPETLPEAKKKILGGFIDWSDDDDV